MNTNKKLEIFSKAVEKEVENRRVSILLNIDHKIENAVHEKIADTKRQNEELASKLNQELKENNRKLISRQKTDDKKALTEKRNEYTNQIFDRVSEKIRIYCTSLEYKEQLFEELAQYILREDHFEIHLCSKDMDIAQRIKNDLGSALQDRNIKIVISGADFLGGYKILYEGINIIINNTYLTKIEEERKKFSKFKIQL